MKKSFPLLIALLFVVSCGGGGGGGSDNNVNTPATTELEGEWVYSSDGHPTGGACGLDSHGGYGERITLTFNNNQYNYKYEGCWIPSGNTGAYIETENINGVFVIGGIYVNSTDPAYRMTAIDFIATTTGYTSYNLAGVNLKIATASQTADGTTPDKRAFQVDYSDPIYIKQ